MSQEERGCYECGESGHMKRNCPKLGDRNQSGIKCYNCQGFGHFARDCQNERVER